MISTYKPKSIQVLDFDKYNYDFPFIHAQEINYVIDANGNLVTGDSFYREYNELNQLIRIRESNTSNGKILEEYTWHPVDERILIKDVYYNNTKNYTVYYVSKEYVVIENKTGNYTEEYIYQDNILVAQVDTNGNKIAVHPDHEGSSTTFTDSQGNILETTFYSVYGEILAGGKTSRFDYEGKEFDSVVKDYDFGFRKYNPDVPPIFNQPDTLIKNVYDPQSLNRYSFERNNPYRYTDQTGHQVSAIIDSLIEECVASPACATASEYVLPVIRNWISNAQSIPRAVYAVYKDLEKTESAGSSDSFKLEQGTYVPPEAKHTFPVFTVANKNPNTDRKLADEPIVTCDDKGCKKVYEIKINFKKLKEQAKLDDSKEYINNKKLDEQKNKKGYESSGGGGGGSSNVIPDPSGRKDRFGNPIYVIK